MNQIVLKGDDLIDEVTFVVSKAIADNPDKWEFVDCPLTHTFTNGLYSRQIFMPADKIIVSEKHLTEHQFIISEGVVSVWTEDQGWVVFKAPHIGITKAGTQRILRTHLDTVWTTFHANPKGFTTADEIYNDIVEKRQNPLLGGRFKNNVFIPQQEELNF